MLLATPWALAAQQVMAGAYVTRRGDVEIARERYRFDGKTLAAEVEVVVMAVFYQTETAFDSAGLASRYHLRVRTTAGGPVVQELDAALDDSVRWTLEAGGRSQRGEVPIGPPATVIQNLVFSQLAASLRAYDDARGGRQTLNAWLPDGGAVLPLGIELTGDSGTLDLGGVTIRVTLDSSGWAERFEVPAQGVVVTRQDGVTFSAPAAPAGADTLRPASVSEIPYLVEQGGARLAGTLALPAVQGPVPIALIVAGSGAVDRNGNAPPVLESNLYRQLAWRLAERGIASLRYDKRGVGGSAAGVDPAATTFGDFAEDVLAATRALAGDRRFDGIVVVGHSEGGWLAISAAARGAPVSGLALLATPGRPFLPLLRSQLAQQLDSAALVQFDAAMERYLRGERPLGLPPILDPLFRPVNQRFTASVAAFDAVAELSRLALPVLVVQGDRDIQVGTEDAERLAAARPSARVVVIPGVNHLFKAVQNADRVAQLAGYVDRTAPVAPQLVETLVDWIGQVRR
jgi:hypothetical protein